MTSTLARTLRDLRVTAFRDAELTQAQLASAFSTENRVSSATISTWESPTSPKTPNHERLLAYARFFATPRSLDNGPRLIPEEDLTEEERAVFERLKLRLLTMLEEGDSEPETDVGPFSFADGPIVIICPEAPKSEQGPLAREEDPNFTKLQQYADLDALIEIHGHVRAANPTLDVFHRLASEAAADDLSAHVILLGGTAWNKATRRFQNTLRQVPITQLENPDQEWDPFSVDREGSTEIFDATWMGAGTDLELIEDVAFVARLANPFNTSRTLTICNGIYSRGVLGAVRCLTDAQVRLRNEQYLAERFPDGEWALLVRVPVVTNQTMSPDLQNPHSRLFEWPPEKSPAT